MSEAKLKLFTAILALLAIIMIGSLGLAYFENLPLFDALWVTVISLTTTGYGDIVPHTISGRAFLMGVLLVGIGVMAYSLGAVTNILVERQITRIMDKGNIKKAINALQNHVIVCGAGRVGSNVASILKAEQVPYVMIDHNQETVERLQEEGELIIHGDATQDETLTELGIHRARGIICALPEDAYNLFVALTARDANPNLKIVARAERPETMEKLKRAGADKVIAPTLIAGSQMAMAIMKPLTVDLIDTLYTPHMREYMLEEFLVREHSPLVNREVMDIFAEQQKVTVIAIIRGDEIIANVRGNHIFSMMGIYSDGGGIIANVRGNHIILPGDNLVLLGAKKNLELFERSLEG